MPLQQPQQSAGGSLLIAWQLKEKNVLIVGGGEIASQRITSVLETDAHITLLAPREGLSPKSKHLLAQHTDRISHHDRTFSSEKDLLGADMVLTALDDVELSKNICQACRTKNIPVNAADLPDLCDFYFGSQIRQGPLQIMISTNGNGPKMANLIKRKLEGGLSGNEGVAISRVGELRAQLRLRAPGVGGGLSKKRMDWISNVCETWMVEELALLDHTRIQRLLDEGWEKDRVPTFRDLGGHPHASWYPSSISAVALAGIALGSLLVLAILRRK